MLGSRNWKPAWMQAGDTFLKGSSFRRNDSVSSDLLVRIIEGALKSDLTPKGMGRVLKERLGIKD